MVLGHGVAADSAVVEPRKGRRPGPIHFAPRPPSARLGGIGRRTQGERRTGVSTAPTPTTTNAQRIYRVLFPGDIPPELAARFLRAWEILSADYSPQELAELRRALDGVADLEALEMVCRRRKRLPALVAQVDLMVMLAETLPSHVPFYLRSNNGRIQGFVSMSAAAVRSAWKFLKGSLSLKRLHAG